jgi:hypothetical protein
LIDARVSGENLEIEITGSDCWPVMMRGQWSVQIPLAGITSARPDAPRQVGQQRHINQPADERLHYTGTLIWARFRKPTVRIDVDSGPYRRIILSVPDPERTAAEIQAAAGVGAH